MLFIVQKDYFFIFLFFVLVALPRYSIWLDASYYNEEQKKINCKVFGLLALIFTTFSLCSRFC